MLKNTTKTCNIANRSSRYCPIAVRTPTVNGSHFTVGATDRVSIVKKEKKKQEARMVALYYAWLYPVYQQWSTQTLATKKLETSPAGRRP
jgi:hypothetical protein